MGSQIVKTYVKIALRNILRHRLFTVINVTGLALSMSIGMLVIAMIHDLMQFDRFHTNGARIYRVISEVYDPARSMDEKATAPLPLGDRIKSHSSVEQVVRIRKSLTDEVVLNNSELPIQGYFTDPSFTDVFSFPLVSGNPKTALTEPFSLVITKKTALKLFKTEEVLGQSVQLKNFGEFKITGVLEDLPRASHMQFEALASMSTVPILETAVPGKESKLFATSDQWDKIAMSYVYVLLRTNSTQGLHEALQKIANEVYPDKNEYHAQFSLQHLLDIVPGNDLSSEIGPKMLYLVIIILSTLALTILAAACFNYTNLSIARSLQRAKEVGLRKISGARKSEITFQFLLESALISLASLVIAICVFEVIRPHVLENLPRATELFELSITFPLAVAFTCFALFTGMCAGIIPALALSSVKITEALKQIKNIKLAGRVGIRKALVVFQFTLSLFLITAIVIVYRQYSFSIQKDLGFNKENMLVVDLQGNDYLKFSTAFSALPEIQSITFSSNVPGTSANDFDLVHYNQEKDSAYVHSISVDPGYVRELRFKFLAGSNFPDNSIDRNSIIVNRKFLSLLNTAVPHDVLNKTILVNGELRQVIGVVEDFNYMHLEEPIQAFFFKHDPEMFAHATLKIVSPDLIGTVSNIESTWKTIDPNQLFYASFFEDRIQETYSFYIKLMRVFGYVGLLALTIATLGLLGMAVYTAETRTKEMGIRKVLGAEVYQLVLLLSGGFVKLLVIAACIALPAAYLLFDLVILSFNAYRITLGPIEMSVGFMVLLLLGGLIILSQTLKAAQANPVDSLRNE